MTQRQLFGRLGVCFYLLLFILMFFISYSEGSTPLTPSLILALVFWAGLIPLLTTLSILKRKKKGEYIRTSAAIFALSVFLQYSCSIMSAHATYLQAVLFFAVSAVIMIAVLFFYKKRQEQ